MIVRYYPQPRPCPRSRTNLKSPNGKAAAIIIPRHFRLRADAPVDAAGIEYDGQVIKEATGSDFGCDVKYSITPSLTLDGTLDTNLRFSWLRSASSGLYLVYNEVDEGDTGLQQPSGREFILKYSHIFDVFD